MLHQYTHAQSMFWGIASLVWAAIVIGFLIYFTIKSH